MKEIIFYTRNGEEDSRCELLEENLGRTNGMMLKCHLSDGREEVGFADPYRCHDEDFDDSVHDYINLWTWDNLDEETHKLIGNDESRYNQTFKKVWIKDIIKIEAVMHSNPRWGGRLTNKFETFIK